MHTLVRKRRQIIIAIVYALLAFALGAWVYFGLIRPKETCLDGIRNQNETGIDCGGVCAAACKPVIDAQPLVMKETAFVPGGEGVYDVLGRVYNPNDIAGASSFTYTVSLKAADGSVLATRSGTNSILPQETKYLLEVNLSTTAVPASADIRISDVVWVGFTGYSEKPAINIYNKRYDQISSGAGFSEAYGLVSNESPFDFRSIIIKVVLRDAAGRPLAFNSTVQNTVQSHEQRDFRLVWPTAFPGAVEKIEMEVDADVYHSDNFTKEFLLGGKFQEFAPTTGY